MKKKGNVTKSEVLLLGLTAVFLCSLLILQAQDRRNTAQVGAAVETEVAQETFLPDVSPVDLNSATAEELTVLPGIGPALAERIVEYRTQHGGFGTVEELMDVSGIGEAKLAELKDRVTVNGGDT